MCPDSLKETATAADAAAAIAEGVRDARPYTSIRRLPLADGGEGTLDALLAAIPGLDVLEIEVPGPLRDGRPVAARLAVSSDRGFAIVELAEAAGLGLLATEERDPERTGTAGVGRLLDEALDRLRAAGVADATPEIVLAMGGSGTVDGGLGALRALGIEILGPGGDPRRHLVGGDLAAVEEVRVPESVRARWQGVRLRVLADVRHPLSGPDGAACVFGPQKGADSAAVARLDHGLAAWGRLLSSNFGFDPGTPGAGAAGGIGSALVATLGASLEPGFEAVAGLLDLEAAIAASSLVITSEGRLDDTSFRGKVVGGVLGLASALSVGVVVVPGSVDPALATELRARFAAIASLEDVVGRERARSDPAAALRAATLVALDSTT